MKINGNRNFEADYQVKQRKTQQQPNSVSAPSFAATMSNIANAAPTAFGSKAPNESTTSGPETTSFGVSGLGALLNAQGKGQIAYGPTLSQTIPMFGSSSTATTSSSGPANYKLSTPSEMVDQWIQEIGSDGRITLEDAKKALGAKNSDATIEAAFRKLSNGKNYLTAAELTVKLESYIRTDNGGFPVDLGTFG